MKINLIQQWDKPMIRDQFWINCQNHYHKYSALMMESEKFTTDYENIGEYKHNYTNTLFYRKYTNLIIYKNYSCV